MRTGASVVRAGFTASFSCSPATAKPLAGFSTNLNNICSGIVSFNNTSTNGTNSWLWDFGDGNTSTQQNPIHTYQTTTPAAYDVTLIACNAFGCDTITKTNQVIISQPCYTYCESSGHNNSFQWIKNVTFGTINNNSRQDHNGYGNYTNLSTTTAIDSIVNISVSLSGSLSRLVNVWIDFNQDRIFQDSEQIFSQRAVYNGSTNTASGSFTIPNTAAVGKTRVRVSTSVSNPSPCQTNIIGAETEDYTIEIGPNSLAPVADFTLNVDSICNGQVFFENRSANGPTTLLWDFGDGNISTELHPTHTYQTTTAASYDVSLTACKGGQCDTLVLKNAVNITAPCFNYCISYGLTPGFYINKVSFGTVKNISGSGTNGYSNFTYLNSAAVTGKSLPFSVDIYGFSQNNKIIIWIDFNQDGIFQNSEITVNKAIPTIQGAFTSIQDSIYIPTTALAGLTRMRIRILPVSITPDPCALQVNSGDTEDYSINISSTGIAPIANFNADLSDICSGAVSFQDLSLFYVTSWQWNFGDGTTSTLPNPSHTYSSSGTYHVSLIACNPVSCDTFTYHVPVAINAAPVIAAHCTPTTALNCCNFGIGNVKLNLINNSSGNGNTGYEDFTCSVIDTLKSGDNYTIQVTNSTLGQNENARAWIDFNNDGRFEPKEMILNSDNNSIHRATFSLPASAVKNTTVRMRVVSIEANRIVPFNCANFINGQAEDYAVHLLGPVGLKNQLHVLDFNVYPNPSEGRFNLELPFDKPGTKIEIVNVLGQVLKVIGQHVTKKTQQIDLTHLPAGVYFVKVSNENATGIRKIVIE